MSTKEQIEKNGLSGRDEPIPGQNIDPVEDNDSEREEQDKIEQEQKDSAFDKMKQKLETQSDNVAQVELAKILGDEDVRKVLAARERGENVSIEIGEQEKESEPVDLDSLSQAELSKHMIDSVGSILEKGIQRALEPIHDRLDSFDGFVNDRGREVLSQGIESARSKYKDFDNFQSDMVNLYENPESLSPEDLYVLAKFKKGGFKELGKNLSSEKPSNAGARPAQRNERKTPRQPGNRGFRQMLGEAIGELRADDWGRKE